MRVNERFDRLEEKVFRLEKEVEALKAAGGTGKESPAAEEPKKAGTGRKTTARTTKAKKTE